MANYLAPMGLNQYEAVSGRKKRTGLMNDYIKAQIPAMRYKKESDEAKALQEKEFGLAERNAAMNESAAKEAAKQGKIALGVQGVGAAGTAALGAKSLGLLGGSTAATGAAGGLGEVAVGGTGFTTGSGAGSGAGAGAGMGAAAGVGAGLAAAYARYEYGKWAKNQEWIGGGKKEREYLGPAMLLAKPIKQTWKEGGRAYKNIQGEAKRAGDKVSDVAEDVWDTVSGGGCITFGFLYGKTSKQARYAKVFCARHMDLLTLLGYYRLGKKFINLWKKHPVFIKPMEKMIINPFYNYMLWKLGRKESISFLEKMSANIWLKLCRRAEVKNKTINIIPKEYAGCIAAVGRS